MLAGSRAVVATEGRGSGAWLRSADIIVGHHRTRRQARRWISSVHRRYPRCLLAVARHHNGRWCMVGLPARNVTMRGGSFDGSSAELLGQLMYQLWLARLEE